MDSGSTCWRTVNCKIMGSTRWIAVQAMRRAPARRAESARLARKVLQLVDAAGGVSQPQQAASHDAALQKSVVLALPYADRASSCGSELASMARPEAVSSVNTILRNARSLMPT